ncbi:alpha/beta fold hydrolase, partial [bacterium]|nr:alpha/beta fold hydrolase [bacterium]
MATERIEFVNQRGDNLAAMLETPEEGSPKIYAVFAHCFTCSKDYKATYRISRTLSRHGIAVLRFDFTGLGDSGGDFADTDFSSNVMDVAAAAEWLRTNAEAPVLLAGHSLGGAAVLQAASKIEEVKGVAVIAAPAETGHLAGILKKRWEEADEGGYGEVNIGGRTFRVGRQLLEDLESTNMRRTISALKRDLMILHSPNDQTVRMENAYEILE